MGDFLKKNEEKKIVQQQLFVEAPKQVNHKSNLNPNNTFETFIVGNSNKLAHAAAFAVAESQKISLRPAVGLQTCRNRERT